MTKPRVSPLEDVEITAEGRRVYRRPSEAAEALFAALAEKERLLNESAQIVVDLQAALAQQREARERAEDKGRSVALEMLAQKRRNEDLVRDSIQGKAMLEAELEASETACARMREALQGALRGLDPMISTEIVADIRAALSDTSGEKAAAVIRAARDWAIETNDTEAMARREIALAAAVDALDAEREEK